MSKKPRLILGWVIWSKGFSTLQSALFCPSGAKNISSLIKEQKHILCRKHKICAKCHLKVGVLGTESCVT
jgi:hypothetical protein